MPGLMARFGQPMGQSRWQLSVNNEAHTQALLAGGYEHRMVHFLRRILQAGADVIGVEVRVILEDFAFRYACGKQVEHIFDTNAHAPDARTTTALIGIKRDAFRVFHANTVFVYVIECKHWRTGQRQ